MSVDLIKFKDLMSQTECKNYLNPVLFLPQLFGRVEGEGIQEDERLHS